MGDMTSMTDPLENDPMRELSGAGTSTATIEREELRQEVEPGDRERFSHYVRKEKIMESALTGDPVIALCGKVWTPGRDPQKFPVCPECKEVYEGLRPGNDGGKGRRRRQRQVVGGEANAGPFLMLLSCLPVRFRHCPAVPPGIRKDWCFA